MFIRKILLTSIVVSLVLLSFAGISFSAKAQVVTKDEALALLKELAPDINIVEIRESVVDGLWEVGVESGGKKAVVYIDASKKYMVQGSIIDVKAKTNLTQERFNELNKVDISLIPLDDAIVMGDKGAANRVIIFTDPDCLYCGKLHLEVKKVLEKRKDIAFFIKMFPLKIHPGAYDKAKAIVCEKSPALLNDAQRRGGGKIGAWAQSRAAAMLGPLIAVEAVGHARHRPPQPSLCLRCQPQGRQAAERAASVTLAKRRVATVGTVRPEPVQGQRHRRKTSPGQGTALSKF